MTEGWAQPTPAEMVARARRLAAALAERSEACEQARRVPDETVADFFAADLHRLLLPARYGGFEMGWETLIETAIELSKGCGSQGWVLTVYGGDVYLLGMFPGEAQDELWADDPTRLVSTCFAPVGTLVPAKGGYVASGKWSFSSGIDHASWVLAGAMVRDGDGPPRPAFFVTPKSDVKVIDDWYAAGLAGTGSKSFAADGLFVPPHRVLMESDANNGTGPGARLSASPVFRIPRHSSSTVLAAVPLGVAYGLVEDFCAAWPERATKGRRGLAEPAVALRVAEATAELDCGRWLLLDAAQKTMDVLARGEAVPPELGALNARNAGYAVRLARAAADRLFAVAGGSAIYASSRLQRAVRDVLAGAQHVALAWDLNAANYGLIRLGRDLSGHP